MGGELPPGSVTGPGMHEGLPSSGPGAPGALAGAAGATVVFAESPVGSIVGSSPGAQPKMYVGGYESPGGSFHPRCSPCWRLNPLGATRSFGYSLPYWFTQRMSWWM